MATADTTRSPEINATESNQTPDTSNPGENVEKQELYCICRQPNDFTFMICCDICQEWFHGRCIGVSATEAKDIIEYHCAKCEPQHGPSNVRNRRKSHRQKTSIDYAQANNGIVREQHRHVSQLSTFGFVPESFQRLRGEDLTREYICVRGFDEPVIVEDAEGLGMTMPSKDITVTEIAHTIDAVGDQLVEVMDVATQQSVPGWTLHMWADYFSSHDRKQLLNVISLEISDTEFGKNIVRPAIVRELDWVDRYYNPIQETEKFPKAQLYCLMSPEGCWTDFHIDFGGSSVFYHILSGEKHFYMIPPTKQNLAKYERWSCSNEQHGTFFASLVKECYQVHLKAGMTMFIPSDTPKDSIVIGGNFLHSFSIRMQLDIFEIENRCSIARRYRYPQFERLNWIVAEKYIDILQTNPDLVSDIELEGLEVLSDHLFKQALRARTYVSKKPSGPRVLQISSVIRKSIRESIPPHLLKDGQFFVSVKQFALLVCQEKLRREPTKERCTTSKRVLEAVLSEEILA